MRISRTKELGVRARTDSECLLLRSVFFYYYFPWERAHEALRKEMTPVVRWEQQIAPKEGIFFSALPTPGFASFLTLEATNLRIFFLLLLLFPHLNQRKKVCARHKRWRKSVHFAEPAPAANASRIASCRTTMHPLAARVVYTSRGASHEQRREAIIIVHISKQTEAHTHVHTHVHA